MSLSPEILRALNERPIAYYPIYRRITGSVTAGVMLSQLMYWFAATGEDKISKTDAEIMGETLLTEKELKTAKKAIKDTGFIKVTREGLPAKTYYEIEWADFEKAVEAAVSDKQDWPKGPNTTGRKGQTLRAERAKHSYYENIKENTVENKWRSIREKSPEQAELQPALPDIIKPTKNKHTNNSLPSWIDPQDWDDYRAHRKAMKKPLTEIAERRAINTLDRLRQDGHDPAEVINQSIVNGWAGLFEVKQANGPKQQTATTIDDTKQRAAAKAERVRRLLGGGQ